ncbi:hypothetical protein [Methyloversatilis sp. XJ19-49]|uniref:hypothetical protein n=1 Tax=Methyloversatilis sp. XJ19-49 TaxID=2963429 RepID=UPI00211BC731|nr:hypothetical protein [Methyloversatilis sp. XJ19-49]MCQ9376925.1 hypothetical protein [Methyloversatilis sp. XJ19-49]
MGDASRSAAQPLRISDRLPGRPVACFPATPHGKRQGTASSYSGFPETNGLLLLWFNRRDLYNYARHLKEHQCGPRAVAPDMRHCELAAWSAWLDKCFVRVEGVPHMATAGPGNPVRITSINR